MLIWHDGGTGGFRSFLGFNPKTQRGIVVLSNSTESWLDEFSRILLDPEYFKKPVVDKTLAKDLEYLKRFEGSYQVTLLNDQAQFDLTVKLYDTQLTFAFSNGEIGIVYPERFAVFGLKGFPGANWHFIFDPAGNIAKGQMILSDGAIAMEAVPKRQESP